MKLNRLYKVTVRYLTDDGAVRFWSSGLRSKSDCRDLVARALESDRVINYHLWLCIEGGRPSSLDCGVGRAFGRWLSEERADAAAWRDLVGHFSRALR